MRSLISFLLGATVSALASIGACSTSSQSTTGTASPALVATNDATRFAYGVGYHIGTEAREGITADGLKADWSLVSRGFSDAVNGREPEMSKAEFEGVLKAVHHAILERDAKQQYEADKDFRALADANAAKSKTAISAFAAQAGARTLEQGVYVVAVANGSGAQPGKDEVFVADWSLTRADGSVVDSRKGEAIDADALIPVAGRTLRAMRVGDHWKMAFAPDVAFGLGGDEVGIGPNEAIFVDVHVTGTAKRGAK